MQTAALHSLPHTVETLARPEGKRATVAVAPVLYLPVKVERSASSARGRVGKRDKVSLRTLLCDLRDMALMLVGRDDDDDYECAHG